MPGRLQGHFEATPRRAAHFGQCRTVSSKRFEDPRIDSTRGADGGLGPAHCGDPGLEAGLDFQRSDRHSVDVQAVLIAFPHAPGMGGPGSFQSRFEIAIQDRGWAIHHGTDMGMGLPDVAMVVGGTRQLGWLYRLKRLGVPIVYRLDGLLWLHRLGGFCQSPSRWVDAELRNALAQWLHGRMADCVVYQSRFVENWWRDQGWWRPAESVVISNGLDLSQFRPGEADAQGKSLPDVVCVEGHIDYSPYAIELLNFVADGLAAQGARLILYGGFGGRARQEDLDPRIDYRGAVSREAIPPVYRDRIYLSLDVNPACPNAVAEALASGAPVIGFDTGAVKELVGEQAGCVVPFGGNPWRGDLPKFSALLNAYEQVAGDFRAYSGAARRRAEERYGIDQMVQAYIAVIERTGARYRALA